MAGEFVENSITFSPLTARDTLLSFCHANETAITVKADGEVRIDWPAVERAAAQPIGEFTSTMVAIARLALAVRDGTWKPMPVGTILDAG